MKKVFCYMGVITVLLFGACDSNKKLSQDNAEKAIKAFISTNNGSLGNGWGFGCPFNVQSIHSIEPLSQFSDTEATTVVRLKCDDGRARPLEVKFQKDVDNHWFLTKFASEERLTLNGRQFENVKVSAQ